MQRVRLTNQKGILLITSYFLLATFLAYSNVMTLRSITQRLANDQLRDRLQGFELARAALETFREELYRFLTSQVYQVNFNGDPARAMAWLDALADDARSGFDPNYDTVPDSTRLHPLCITSLPTAGGPTTTGAQPVCKENTPLPHAWVVKVTDLGDDANGNGVPDPNEIPNGRPWVSPGPGGPNFNSRRVTLQAAATGQGGLERTVQASYLFQLKGSTIFNYGYFINNFGWVDPGTHVWDVNGDIRANSDLLFGDSALANLHLQGDAYAAVNPDALNPRTHVASSGNISGNISGPAGYYLTEADYFNAKLPQGRPTRRLTLNNIGDGHRAPPIGSIFSVWLPVGQGWDSGGGTAGELKPNVFPAQKPRDLPYLGNLALYKRLAEAANSSLKLGSTTIVSAVYKGPDGLAGTADDKEPLVLIGTAASPIVINGPVVVPGDVIIRGVVKGRGTIYAGRNVHIVGELTYEEPWMNPRLQRNVSTGKLVVHAQDLKAGDNWNGWVGTVCDNDEYILPGGTVPAGCITCPTCTPAAESLKPYGYALPGNQQYGFPAVPQFTTRFKPAFATDLLGLSAQGNIVIGDYTSANFTSNVTSRLAAIQQSHVVDHADADLGYETSVVLGESIFNGDYTRQDSERDPATGLLRLAVRADGSQRRFYESSLLGAVWSTLIDPNDNLYKPDQNAKIDAVLYANHLIAGYIQKTTGKFQLNGAMVGRDDGLVIDSNFSLNHDLRLNLLSDTTSGRSWLPMAIFRPSLLSWQECTIGTPCQ